jgi:hypothetical protein
MIKWLLEQVAAPQVLYSSHAFHRLLLNKYFFTKLQQLTRLALLQAAPSRIHTPIAGLQVILGSMPLAFRARYNNLMAWIRLNQFQTTPPEDKPLPPHLQDIYDDFQKTGLSHIMIDAMAKTPNHAQLNVHIKDGLESDLSAEATVKIYTDGSKIDGPNKWGTGAGYVIMIQEQINTANHITLCHTKTVFQAEVYAI